MAGKKKAAASDPVVGATVVEVRRMTEAEALTEGWEVNRRHGAPHVLVLSNGTKLFPSCDEEGNGPGALFGVDGAHRTFRFP